MDWNQLFFSFAGRISRKDWWTGTLVVLLITYGISMALLWALGGDPTFYWDDAPPTPQTALVDAVVFVLTLHISLAIDIKRIHDRGRTAYLLVPLYLASLTLIAMDGMSWTPVLFQPATADLTKGFSLELVVSTCVILTFIVYFVWIIIELGFRKGISGASTYGADPLNDQPSERQAVNDGPA